MRTDVPNGSAPCVGPRDAPKSSLDTASSSSVLLPKSDGSADGDVSSRRAEGSRRGARRERRGGRGDGTAASSDARSDGQTQRTECEDPGIVVLKGRLRDPGRDVGREAPHGGSADVVRGRAGGGRGRRACGERRAGSKRSPYTGCMIHVNIFT